MTGKRKENKKGPVASIGATEIDIKLISEDIHQPRKEFNQETLQELTETIKLRGVKSPISVRPNPDKLGTYIINHGARRYRASINAGLSKIPAFIDTDYSEADQVIENLQRDDLTSREIADFIGRQLAAGKTKSEIARLIGKTNPYITMHAALLDLPDPLGKVYRSGRCTDVTALYDLTRLYKANKEEVITWLAFSTQEEISRLDIYQFSQFLKLKKTSPSNSTDGRVVNGEDKSNNTPSAHNDDQKQTSPNALLDSIYNLIKKDKRKPRDLMRDLSSENKEFLQSKIKNYFEQGRNCKNTVQFTIKALQDGSFSAKGSGALQLIAFLHGMERTEPFDLIKILEEIAEQQEAG
ncbi:ParB/RepB/Spo0J family partition protein [Nitrosomonas sp. JL21]|uniref:ParB/RepB/Spo0J family partition protein n=1 Tax=Nitrosomonas sp. JL21 TaxID=153949 RepID=UPI00136DF271|nr:ParB/RepB/Spo0J family partition protein [Nitrosomonas sp. JL21]MXS79123.1 ParB/RepB/Spo0J family partition protein [Nitrosomonas sp. JL21]